VISLGSCFPKIPRGNARETSSKGSADRVQEAWAHGRNQLDQEGRNGGGGNDAECHRERNHPMKAPKTQTWKDKVQACFGNQDMIFAGHPSDEKQAKEAIKEARKSGASRDDFEKEMVWHIYKRVTADGMLQPHIKEQVKRLYKMWKE
jgi:hypothetical protein